MPEFAATTEAKLVILKFSEFVGKNGGTLDLANIEKMGIWCNTLIPAGHSGAWTVDSTMKTGWIKDNDGNWYYLKTNGAMAKNEYINGYLLGANGDWIIS